MDFLKNQLARLQQQFNQLTASQKMLSVSLVAIMVMTLLWWGRYAGTEVTVTEPVFGYMADALGLKMRNQRFQLAVMNNTEPRPSDVIAFENDVKTRKVKVLIYNSQTTGTASQRLLSIARESHVPVVGVTETEPPGLRYQDWIMQQLEALDKALSTRNP